MKQSNRGTSGKCQPDWLNKGGTNESLQDKRLRSGEETSIVGSVLPLALSQEVSHLIYTVEVVFTVSSVTKYLEVRSTNIETAASYEVP
ncbi:hypothetical protein J6590_091717 [Homalodisca vitripennis]|nr:hypothetical protein J6590_091717 [Homalodisca vitripennis]